MHAQTNAAHEFIFNTDTIDSQKERIRLLDSIRHLANANDQDAIEIHASLELGNIYREVDIDSSILFFQNGIEIGGQENDSIAQVLIAKTWNDLGISYYRNNASQLAIKAHEQSVKLYEKWNHQQGLAWNYNNLAILYSERNMPDSARILYELSLQMAQAINDSLGIGYNLLNIAGGYMDQGNGIEASRRLFKAVEIFERLDQPNTLAHIYFLISRAYGNFDLARRHEYALKGDSIYQLTDSKFLKGKSARLLGVSLLALGKDSLSILKLKESIDYLTQIDHHQMLMLAYMELSRGYESMGFLDSATWILEKALVWVDPQYEVRSINIQTLYERLSRIYFNTGKMGLAEDYANRAIERNTQQKNPGYVFIEERHLAEIYQKRGDYREAFQHLQAAYRQELDYLEKNENKVLARLEAEYLYEQEKQQLLYEQGKKENELQGELQSQKQAKTYMLIGLFLTVIFLSILYYNYTRKKKISLQLAASNEALRKLGKLKQAMTSMVAHDLKNPLSVIINSTAEDYDTRKMAQQMLNLIHDMLDVQKMETTLVSLDKGPKRLQDLWEEASEQVAHLIAEKNLEIRNQMNTPLMVEADHDFISRVFVNLLTNAIKYSRVNGHVDFAASYKDEFVEISITDYGQGIALEDIETIFEAFGQVDPKSSGAANATGLGLAFCRLALRAHGSEIRVASEVGEWTRFSFKLSGYVIEGNQSADTKVFAGTRITPANKALILPTLPMLRELALHQAIDIERLLKPIESLPDQESRNWANEVLQAAYNHNEDQYHDLLDLIDK